MTIFNEESRLTPTGLILCVALVVVGLMCTTTMGAFYIGQKYVQGQLAMKILTLQDQMDGATVKARALSTLFVEAKRELDLLHQPRVYRTRRPTDLTVGIGPLPPPPPIQVQIPNP